MMNLQLLVFLLIYFINFSSPDKGKEFISALFETKDYDKALTYLDSTVSKQISVEKLQEIAMQTMATFGDFQGIAETRTKENLVYYDCEFAHKDLTIQFSFSDKGLINGFYFVSTPPKDQGDGMELAIMSEGTALKGTFLEGKGNKTEHLLIFVHGSGPLDRDGTMMKQKPYLQMAKALAEMGISTFRYDKRVFSKEDYTNNTITIERESVNDVLNMIDFFSSEEYKGYRISLMGHSLGGYLVPIIANQTDMLYKLILLAPNARPLDKLLLKQLKYIYKLDPTEENKIRLQEEIERIKYLRTADLEVDIHYEDLPMNVPASYWKSMQAYDHLEEARQLKLPVFVAQGKRDYQVTLKDFSLWKRAFKNNEQSVFKIYKMSNHLFQIGEGKSKPDEYLKEGELDMELIKGIYNFLEEGEILEDN